MTAPALFAAGGAHVDRRGRMAGPYVPGASNPGTLAEEVGGGAFNAAQNAARRGIAVSLLSVRGGDAAGESVAAAIRRAGIRDLSATFLDRATPSYTALVEQSGEVVAGLADMALYELAFPRLVRRRAVREAVAAAQGVLVDANLPQAALSTLVDLAGARPVHAIAVSPAKAVRFAALLPRLGLLFMNRREAAALAGGGEDDPVTLARGLLRRGLRAGTISGGDAPVVGFENGRIFSLTPPSPRRTADSTGAGDALAGAAVAALLHGRPLRQAVREGMAAALLTVEAPSAVARYDAAAFAAALALVPAPADVA